MQHAPRPSPWLPLIFSVLLALSCSPEEGGGDNNPGGFVNNCEGVFSPCGEGCADFFADPANCGECGVVCGEGEVCDRGTCRALEDCREQSCVGLTVCDEVSGRCVRGCESNDQCGSAGEFCNGETNQCECESVEHLCAGICASNESPETCGDRCQPCPGDPKGVAVCDEGLCGLDCEGGFLDCEGACAPCPGGAAAVICEGAACIATECVGDSQRLCDGVCAECPSENVTSVLCDAQDCVAETCGPGFHVCAGACVSNGDPATCGARCEPCPGDPQGSPVCEGGACGLACQGGTSLCGGVCADCPDEGVSDLGCQGQRCVARACEGGFELCEGGCARCPRGGVLEVACEGNSCVAESCEVGLRVCAGECSACPEGAIVELGCSNGRCVAESCEEGALLCGGACPLCPDPTGVEGFACEGAACVATGCVEGFIPCAEGCCQWSIEIVDDVGVTGLEVSVVAGVSGQVHASFSNISQDDLRYGFWDGTSWEVEIADDGDDIAEVGRDSSLALGPDGAPQIAYRDATNTALKLAVRDGMGWRSEVIDPEGDPRNGTALVIGEDGAPHVAYSVFLGTLNYATKREGQWQTETIATRGEDPAIVLDDEGVPNVCWVTSGNLRCASRDNGWQIRELGFVVRSGTFTNNPPISAVFHQGAIHVTFSDRNDEGLILATLNGVNWRTEVVDPDPIAGHSSALSFDSEGRPHIAYSLDATGIRYATRDGDDWIASEVFLNDDADEHLGATVDTDDIPHVLFHVGASPDFDLRHATF